MYNILCIRLSDPSNASKNADHQFSRLYYSFDQGIILVSAVKITTQIRHEQHSLERQFYRILAAGIVKEY